MTKKRLLASPLFPPPLVKTGVVKKGKTPRMGPHAGHPFFPPPPFFFFSEKGLPRTLRFSVFFLELLLNVSFLPPFFPEPGRLAGRSVH